jgi:hypothetical protein
VRNNLEALETTDADVDKWGIRKLYPDALDRPRFQEWYMNEDRPTSDKRFKNYKNANLRRMQDGSNSFYVDGMANNKGQVRLESWSESGNKKWLNSEVTVYAKYLQDVKGAKTGQYAFQLYLRGGHHSSTKGKGGEASCYKGRLYKDGRVAIVKEIYHPAYTSNRAGKRATQEVKNKWIGMKLVVFNFQEDPDPKTYVIIEVWIDPDCTDKDGNLVIKNQWIKAAETVDRGDWRSSEMKGASNYPSVDVNSKTQNKRQPDEIITLPGGTKDGNLGAFRTDGVAMQLKYFSVREIEPPEAMDQE